jgi:hypothetical protein
MTTSEMIDAVLMALVLCEGLALYVLARRLRAIEGEHRADARRRLKAGE